MDVDTNVNMNMGHPLLPTAEAGNAANITRDGIAKVSITLENMHLEQPLLKLAQRANERTKQITTIITNIHNSSVQLSDSVDHLPPVINQFSDPQFHGNLAFPFVGFEAPNRFKVNDGGYWSYLGRVKFEELFQTLNEVRNSNNYTSLWLYGTQGYGKSHMLAALVCYLAAQGERVVYIPTCRTLLEKPVGYVRAAMLFAWAGDDAATSEILKLNSFEGIADFLERKRQYPMEGETSAVMIRIASDRAH